MVDMPVAEDDGDPRGIELLADPPRAVDGQVGVVDQRLATVDDRVAGDAQLQRAVVQPVRLIVLALALASVVEGEDARAWRQESNRTSLTSPGGTRSAGVRRRRLEAPPAFSRASRLLLLPGR
jgi:hypothetical protein